MSGAGPAAGTVTLRYWAAAKAAAGVGEEYFDGPGTLAELLAAARASHPGDLGFSQVLARCSYLVNGSPAGLRSAESVLLPVGALVEALPPFAGG
jgi:sulfur-carrier protein